MDGLTKQQASDLSLVKSTIGNLIEMKYPMGNPSFPLDVSSMDRTTLHGGVLTLLRDAPFSKRRSFKLSIQHFMMVDKLLVTVMLRTWRAMNPSKEEAFRLAEGEPTLDIESTTALAGFLEDLPLVAGYELTNENRETLGATIFKDMSECLMPLLFWYDAKRGPKEVPIPGTTPRCDSCPMQLTCLQSRGPANAH